jgi:hypothetical protein
LIDTVCGKKVERKREVEEEGRRERAALQEHKA